MSEHAPGGHGHGEAAPPPPSPFETYQVTRRPEIDQRETVKARDELLKHMREKDMAVGTEDTARKTMDRLLDDAKDDVVAAKNYFTEEKGTLEGKISGGEDELHEVENSLHELAANGATATSASEIFEHGRNYTQLIDKKEKLETNLKNMREELVHTNKNLTELANLETKLANKGAILNPNDIKDAERKVTEVMGEYAEVAKNIKSKPKGHETEKKGFFKKMSERLSTPFWLTTGVFGGAIGWYLGIVWGEVVGGWKGLGGGGGKKASGGGGHH